MNLQIGPVSVSVSPGIIQWTSGLACDADGAPRAYAPAGSALTPLDALGNAGHPDRWLDPNKKVVIDPKMIAQLVGGNVPTGYVFQKRNWWALVCDSNGNPLVQGIDDPAPGYYIAETALGSAGYVNSDPRRYVDSSQVNYISIPKTFLKLGSSSAHLGDLATVTYNGITVGAIVAEDGPVNEIGEGSIALHRALGVDPQRALPKHYLTGIDSGVSFTIYLGSAGTPPWPRGDVSQIALALATTRSNFA